MNLALLPTIVVGAASALALVDFIYWLIFGRHENKTDQARHDRIEALRERVDKLAELTHDLAMSDTDRAELVALRLADVTAALATAVGELEQA